MAAKKTKKKNVRPQPKYAPGEATCGELTKPEGWTDTLYKLWLRQKTQLARKLVINEARCNPKNFADPDGTVPTLEPLPAIINGVPQAVAERNQKHYEREQKQREEWLARIAEQDRLDGEAQKARLAKRIREREEQEARERVTK